MGRLYNRRATVLEPGTRLGPYEIQTPVGAGGMGEVYRARDTRLDRLVAIKILLPHLAESPEFRVRFDREARAISRLNHPHICTLYDIGEAPGGDGAPIAYLVMELLEGETLAARLASGPLPVDYALALAAQMTEALDRAHRAGIAHGDLKPGNVMVTKAGVKLLDFGLALPTAPPLGRGWSDADTGTAIGGVPGQVLGSLGYLAPEQLEGRPADARSDVFACGAVIFEMLTGRPAFAGETQAAVIAAVMRQQPPLPSQLRPDVPPGVDRLVAACLVKDPAERWQSASDLPARARVAGRIAAADAPLEPAPAESLAGGRSGGGVACRDYGRLGWFTAGGRSAGPVVRSSVLLPPGLRFPAARTIGGAGRVALSPDGRRVAFAAIDARGNQTLWVRALDTLTATPVGGTDGASSPFWSPDSDAIAFFAMGQLKTVSLAGGTPMTLASPAFDATGSWNRDDVILFTPAPNAAIHRVPATGGTPTAVTMLDESAGDLLHRNPFFLPDGRHFLFVAVAPRERGATGPRALLVGSLDAGAPRLLVDRGSLAMYTDGHLLFVRDNRLLAQPFDADAFTVSGEPRPVAEQVAFVGSGSAAFSVSSSGTLAYQPSDTGSQLVWFDRAGRQLGVLGDPAEYGDVELSPDGRRVVVSVLDPALNTRDLWVFDPRARRPEPSHPRPGRRCRTRLVARRRHGALRYEPRRALRSVSQDRGRRRRRDAGARRRVGEVPDQLDSGWPRCGLLVVRRRSRRALAPAAGRRAAAVLDPRRLRQRGARRAGWPVARLSLGSVRCARGLRRAVSVGVPPLAGVERWAAPCRGGAATPRRSSTPRATTA